MKLHNPSSNLVSNPRAVWTERFLEVGEKSSSVIALTADLSRSTCTEAFRKKVPERYFNVGIAEQNMFGIAAGLALCGKMPYLMTFAPFAAMRAGEQFRTDICYMNLNVRVVALYGGIVQGGPTHSGLEDAGIVRGFPNAAIVSPSDVNMAGKVFEASLRHEGPMYIRLGSGVKDPNIYAEDYDFTIGKAIMTREGKDATIISFGMTLQYAVEAAQKLAEEGIDVEILDMHTLKPFDTDAALKTARKTGRVVTIEDHSIYNGLGSAVAETLMESDVQCKFKRLGIPDIYPAMGYPDKLHIKYGYGTEAAMQAVKSLL